MNCPACGNTVAGEFSFCPFCGAALTEAPSAALEERKVVSVLFCDLVGFTASADGADPEDVRARIRPYHAGLRDVIERYGGTVEKFVGDAVMAVFGAPVTHEDDAERAVRAGLRMLEAVEELNEANPGLALQVRIGIDTGEAVVALDARPERGEGIVTGDVVNTASRVQGAAPVDGIAVSESTFRQTERVFDYEPLDPVSVQGKSQPLALYRPLQARGRFGTDVTRTHSTPLVGRELEKPLLIGTFERAAAQRSCQLVAIVGEPGVGKSRLCQELFQYIEERPGLVRWRQGRCLPYGEGIAFWALGEIVKAECGILESDSPEEAASKLERALPPDDPDLPWLRARLAPLVGAGSEPAAQEESFTAWRRFVESLAAEHDTVLVFEDLHWADPALLAFLEHLADWAQNVPLLVLCNARPELYERQPHFGASARNAHRINLPPLTDDETETLVSMLLEQQELPEETRQALLERAGGNPLYAEEFVRLLGDHGETVDVPESVQALIAARLDTLSPERKSLLQDAAVLGKVFWAGALVDMGGGDERDVEQALHELSRKELVRPTRSSSMAGEQEYGFWHVLVRDVCYSQLPRGARAERHQAAAAWIERQAAERTEDLADVLAHHYLLALELARATDSHANVEQLEASARRFLALAGERALGLDIAAAEASLTRALDLTPAGHPERATLLEQWARAVHQRGRLEESKAGLEEAIALYRAQGEAVAAGRALTALVSVLWVLGDPRRKETIAEALSLLEQEPPGPELVAAYAEQTGVFMIDGDFAESSRAVEPAVRIAAELGLPEPARALGFAAASRCFLGDPNGIEDLRRALELSIDQGKSRDAAITYANLALALNNFRGSRAALVCSREGVEFCRRRGIAEVALSMSSQCLIPRADLGEVEEALREAEPLAAQGEAIGNIPATAAARFVQLHLLAERGEEGQTRAILEQLVASTRASGTPDEITLGFAGAAQGLLATGEPERAAALLRELVETEGVGSSSNYPTVIPIVVRCALALSDAELAARLLREPRTPLEEHAQCAARAQLAEAAGDPSGAAALYADATRRWRDFENLPEEGYALLGQGRCLAALGDSSAAEPLRRARELFRSLGFRPALAETEALLAEAG